MKVIHFVSRTFKRMRMVRHVRMAARIRDCNSSPAVKSACTELLRALVQADSR